MIYWKSSSKYIFNDVLILTRGEIYANSNLLLSNITLSRLQHRLDVNRNLSFFWVSEGKHIRNTVILKAFFIDFTLKTQNFYKD